MNLQRWLFASLAVFVVYFVLEMFIHGVLMTDLYQQTASLWRPQNQIEQMIWLFWLGYLIFAPFFALIYTKGYEKKKPGWQQGLRFGLYMGVALSAMQCLGWYVVLPIPGVLAFYWFLSGMVEAVVAGIAVGLIYRP